MPMLKAGVAGFKCFLIHSGMDDFPAVTESDLEKAFVILQNTNSVVLVSDIFYIRAYFINFYGIMIIISTN